MNYEMCPHGRHVGAVCEPCAEGQVHSADLEVAAKMKKPASEEVKKPVQLSGLDADYYDLPGSIHSAQDLIEWLDLNFSNGNILKSLIREHNPNATKETDALYEAEKRFFFASRHLEQVRQMQK